MTRVRKPDQVKLMNHGDRSGDSKGKKCCVYAGLDKDRRVAEMLWKELEYKTGVGVVGGGNHNI